MLNVRVPATSANLGAGFDCLGLALPIFNLIEIERSNQLIIHTDAGIAANETNLVYRAMRAAAELAGEPCPLVEMTQTNAIPLASGLGSSAACIVGGIVAANALLGTPLEESQLLDLAVKMDGHPDNVCAAFYGGITAGTVVDGHTCVFQAPVSHRYKVAVFTPDFPLPTSASRAVLPSNYTRADVVYTLSHAVTTFAAFYEGDPELIGQVLSDRLHEPYRMPLIKGGDALRAALKEAGAYATYLSGAGPTIAAIVDNDFAFDAPNGWTGRILPVTSEGARVTPILG